MDGASWFGVETLMQRRLSRNVAGSGTKPSISEPTRQPFKLRTDLSSIPTSVWSSRMSIVLASIGMLSPPDFDPVPAWKIPKICYESSRIDG